MFIDPAPHGKAFDATDIETTEVLRYPAGHAKAGKPLFKRRFIPARLSELKQLKYYVILLDMPKLVSLYSNVGLYLPVFPTILT
jgi:hypothetical protein